MRAMAAANAELNGEEFDSEDDALFFDNNDLANRIWEDSELAQDHWYNFREWTYKVSDIWLFIYKVYAQFISLIFLYMILYNKIIKIRKYLN